MDESIKKHLKDILISIEEVEGYFLELPKTYVSFVAKLS